MDFLLVTLFVMLAAAVQGSIGFGLGVLGVPLVVLVDPIYVPVPFLIAALVFNILMMVRNRSAIQFGLMAWPIMGRIPGAALGGLLLAVLAEETLVILIGLIILFGVAMSVSGLRMTINRITLVLTGILSGIMGTVAAIGDPPLGLLFQREEGKSIRGNLATYFLFGGLISLSALFLADAGQVDRITYAYKLVPGIVLGFFFSKWLVPIVDRGFIRPAILSISTVAGLVVIIRELV